MTKEQFIEEMKAEKVQYIAGISDYFDALIEHDFDKAVKLTSNMLRTLKPEAQAYIADKMFDCDNYNEMERTYLNMRREIQNAYYEGQDVGD